MFSLTPRSSEPSHAQRRSYRPEPHAHPFIMSPWVHHVTSSLSPLVRPSHVAVELKLQSFLLFLLWPVGLYYTKLCDDILFGVVT